MSGKKDTRIVWAPQHGPQKALIDCPVYEVFFGGARGGGKTDAVLGKYAIKQALYGDGFNAVFFRKELPMLDDAIARSLEIYTPLGGKFLDQKKTWVFPGGGRLRFRPLERIQDADKYQGQNLSDVCIEEAGIYASDAPIRRLHAVLRSAKGTPTQMILTGNPGGAGQSWIRQRYIDPAPGGFKLLDDVLPNGDVKTRVFIPSSIKDNRILLANDPGYISSLYLTGSEQLVKAWLEGDWDAIEGAYFECWSKNMVIKPMEIPEHWSRFISFDWGSARPFSVGWWAVASEPVKCSTGIIPKGALVRYREWYGANGPNVGLKLTAEQVATGIVERSGKEEYRRNVADPAIFIRDGGPSIGERMRKKGVSFWPADNKRIPGWDQTRNRMLGEDDRPMVYCFDTCTDSIRTIPVLQHSLTKPEDLDTEAEDHAADEWRYGLMSRPYTRPVVEVKATALKGLHNSTLDELLSNQPKSKKAKSNRI